MDTINLEVLKQLQEYATTYFNAIVELNSTNGKCDLKAGKYSAKDMTDNSHKSVFGHYYPLPQDEEFDKEITVQSGTFHASFPYRQIFRILNEWENMCKAGKLKAVFEIGDVEIISAKVLTSEKTALGAYKTKTMKLQKVIGNWYVPPKRKKNEYQIMWYYKTESLIFEAGNANASMADDPEKYKVTLDNAEKAYKTKIEEIAANNPYYAEVAKRLDLNKPKADFTPLLSSLSDLMEEITNTLELIADLTKEMSATLINALDEISGLTAKLGCILSMIGKAYEIELMAEMIAESPTEEITTIIVAVKETATEPPQTQETPPPTETPPGQRKAEISVSAPPPEITPPKQIIIVTPPPKYKPSNTLINYDWYNSLAPPYPHNNILCGPWLRGRAPDNIWHRCGRNPCDPVARKTDEQISGATSSHRPRESDPGMGKGNGKETPDKKTLTFNTS